MSLAEVGLDLTENIMTDFDLKYILRGPGGSFQMEEEIEGPLFLNWLFPLLSTVPDSFPPVMM